MNIQALLANRPSGGVKFDISSKALETWQPGIRAATESANQIDILDVIGADYWGEGVTLKNVNRALRESAGADVTVNMNSPGGDLFEGLAIYNALREYPGRVTVKVLGMSASAASIIAMAGDEVQIAKSAFFMIHNGWLMAVGNRHDLRDVADWMEPFDAAMAEIYADHTGLKSSEIETMMDKETWIGGSDSVAKGFADSLLEADAKIEASTDKVQIAAHKMDVLLAKAGVPRSERRKMISEIKSSTHDAAGTGTHDAAVEVKLNPLPRVEFKF